MMRTAHLKPLLVAGALLAGCGGGGGESVSAGECLERWNTGKHEKREVLAGMWRTYALEPPAAASAWVGRSTKDGDRCAVVVTIHPDGGYIVFDELVQDKPGAFETDPDENMKTDEADEKLGSANATGAPGGKLMLK